MISFSPSLTSSVPLYVAICVWCLYLAGDSMYKSLFYKRSVFNSRQATDKQVKCNRDFYSLIYRQHSTNTFSFASTTFQLVKCCLMCFISIIKLFLTHWSWVQFVLFTWSGNRYHGGCGQLTGNAYSSYLTMHVCLVLWQVFPTGFVALVIFSYITYFIQQWVRAKL
jgi:hypothetical protein